MISAAILAAGDSSRMKTPKPLLDWKGQIFLEHVCSSLRKVGVDERIVVLGKSADEIISHWKSKGEKIVVNPNPSDGQLSSLRIAVSAMSDESEGLIICLADQPTIEPATFTKIISHWEKRKNAIVIPRVMRLNRKPGEPPFKRGHPIIIGRNNLHLCMEGPLQQGLHWVTHHPEVFVCDVDVFDNGIIRDFDTPGDYKKLLKETELAALV